MDHLTPQQRSKNMAAIRNKDTKPEIIVRRGLWKRGFRYRLNYKRLPGHPDLVLRKYRTCIFINGCFWHGHLVESNKMDSSACCKIPSTNREFWVNKIRRNKERDREAQKQLAAMGWHCITVWECELKPKVREQTLESLAFTLNHIWLQDRRKMSDGNPSAGSGTTKTVYSPPEDAPMMAAEEVSQRGVREE